MITNLSQVLPAVAANFGLASQMAWGRKSVDRVLVVLIDGMGLENLQADYVPADFSVSSFGEIASTHPSTTPVSLASFGTGLVPAEHGIVGATFWLPEFSQLLRPLHWEQTPEPVGVQPEPTWFEKIDRYVPTFRIGPAKYSDSGLTAATLRGGIHVSADSLAELQAQVSKWWTENQTGFAYAYYPDLDKVGHVFGTESSEWKTELEQVRQTLNAIAADLPSRTHLMVIADHGMLNVQSRFWIESMPVLEKSVQLITGEPRFRHVYAKTGQAKQVYQNWQSISDIADIYTREQALELQIFGGMQSVYADRIGDVIAIAKTGNILGAEKIDRKVSNLKGLHGGLSTVECRIPLIEMAG